MRLHAYLHVHSRYSRATSKHADLEPYAYWALRKGIALIANGDFTHPAWCAELNEKLVAAEPDLFRLRADIEDKVASRLPESGQSPARFTLSIEISTMYKKENLPRKIHHLIYAPDFAAADQLAANLSRIGNIAADGRPILGLDSRDLLDITLESSPDAYLVPAHIWTPWFAALGSRSGFDSITECYGNLAGHIFAMETELSSDPPMNWRISSLDGHRLVSNSDAHSPAKLGREATLFDGELDYFAVRSALETGNGYIGTVEFFPEETKRNYGRCPVCGQPVTVGVLHRVDALADRSEADAALSATAGDVSNLVPLAEILSEIRSASPTSKAVQRAYERLLSALGSELSILGTVPTVEIARADSALLAETISRLWAGEVIREAGYDGEYGVIRLFEEAELCRHTAGGLLFDLPAAERAEPMTADQPPPAAETVRGPREPKASEQPKAGEAGKESTVTSTSRILAQLDEDQCAADRTVAGPLLTATGLSSGKARTLTHRIAHLIADHGVPAPACLAITFTRRAAFEMTERLASLLPGEAPRIPVRTFHSLGLSMLRENNEVADLRRSFRIADEGERAAVLTECLEVSERKVRGLLGAISMAKRTRRPAGRRDGRGHGGLRAGAGGRDRVAPLGQDRRSRRAGASAVGGGSGRRGAARTGACAHSDPRPSLATSRASFCARAAWKPRAARTSTTNSSCSSTYSQNRVVRDGPPKLAGQARGAT